MKFVAIVFCQIGSILDLVDPFALAIQVLSVKHTLVPLYNCRNFTPLDPNQIRSDVCEVAGKSKDSEAPIDISPVHLNLDLKTKKLSQTQW